ncbi:hypothetical protein NP233_g8485 [Leucocoprinus birnbaumii]|uniref:Uncharacterized protein n=1 Tax=Leucocoprinus birnbaumii TaxID=56174 RepID=A0AAD5YRU6_9AGAR|nr:hypothetical protein NP233_g8485 [Leucocoprinus birnbaumii]
MEQSKFAQYLSIGLGSATLVTTVARIIIRARSLDSVQRRYHWALPQLLSDGFLIVGAAAQLCATVVMVVISPTNNSDPSLDHDQTRRLLTANIVISYLTIWSARASVACAVIGGGRSLLRRRRMLDLGGNLLFYTALCVAMMSHNIKACLNGPSESLHGQCIAPKTVGVAHVVVYPIATIWLVCNAGWALAIHSRSIDDSLWRVFLFAVGCDLACTSISIVRGANIIAGNIGDTVTTGILELCLAIPIVNLQILLPKLYNPCAGLCNRTSTPTPSVAFACRGSRTPPLDEVEVPDLEKRSITETPNIQTAGGIELLTIPSSPTSPSSPCTSIAGSTSFLLPRSMA